jgi:hypothetical protein
MSCDWWESAEEAIGLELLPETATVIEDMYMPVTANLIYEDGSKEDVTLDALWQVWPSYGRVDDYGYFDPYMYGICYVRAEYEGFADTSIFDIADIYELIVGFDEFFLPPGHSIMVDCQARVRLGSSRYGQPAYDTLDVSDLVVYSTENTAIADITMDGELTGISTGTTEIRAQFGSYTDEATIHIDYLDSLLISSPVESFCSPTDAFQLTALAYFNGYEQDVTEHSDWQSTDPSVMSFSDPDQPGVVEIHSEGQAELRAQFAATLSEPVILLSQNLDWLEISPDEATINGFEQIQFEAIGHYADGTSNVVTDIVEWATSDPFVTTVSSSGLASAVDSGACNIIAQKNGFTSNLAEVICTGWEWYENFDDELLHPWYQQGYWRIEEGVYVITGSSDYSESYNLDREFADFIMEAEFKNVPLGQYPGYSTAGFSFRVTNTDTTDYNYGLYVISNGDYWIRYRDEDDYYYSETLYSSFSDAIEQGFNVWNKIRIEAVGPNISIYFNDQHEITLYDTKLNSGYVGFEIYGEPGQEIHYDNLKVEEID